MPLVSGRQILPMPLCCLVMPDGDGSSLSLLRGCYRRAARREGALSSEQLLKVLSSEILKTVVF